MSRHGREDKAPISNRMCWDILDTQKILLIDFSLFFIKNYIQPPNIQKEFSKLQICIFLNSFYDSIFSPIKSL